MVVSEHFVLKDWLRKQEPLMRTDSSGYAEQEKVVFTAPRPTHAIASNVLSNTYPFSSLSFKQWHWVALWNDALKKSESTTCGKCLLSAVNSHKRRESYQLRERLGICRNTSRTICLESQVYGLLWLHDSHPTIFTYSYIYICIHTHAHIYINI